MQVMLERSQNESLTGVIELDDACLGGEQAGKRGRGSRNKVPFVAAVETQDGWPMRIQLRRVSGFRKARIKRYVQNSIHPGSIVYSDGLAASARWKIMAHHVPVVTGGGK
jgi:hypothetical protein